MDTLSRSAPDARDALRAGISSVSHDLQSRLLSIRGLTQMLGELEVDAEGRELLERLSLNTVSAQDELSSGMAHLRLALSEPRVEPVDLDAAVRESAEAARALAGGGVGFEFSPLGSALADRAMLDAVVRGLTGDACRRAEPGERVTIVVEREEGGDGALIRFSHDGSPMTEQEAAMQLDDPCLRRADRSIGRGLPGAAYAALAAAVMGGSLRFVGDGGGCWALTLPAAAERL